MPDQVADSTLLLVLGPATIGLIVAAVIYWLRSRSRQPPPGP